MRDPGTDDERELQPELARLASLQADVLSRAQLRAGGVFPHRHRAQVRAHRWRVVGLAVVLHRGPLLRAQQQWVAIHQTRGAGALAAFTALEVAGLRGWPRDEVHVLGPRGWKNCRVRGVVLHESRRFDLARDMACGPGAPRTTSARAAVDAATWSASTRTAVGLLAAVVQQRIVSADALAIELRSAGRIRHVRAMRDAVRDLAGGADSLAEIDMAKLVRLAGLPSPRRQAMRRDASGRRRFIDLEVDLPDGTLLMIEVDGAHHLDVSQAWADQRRQNDLAGAGRIQLRFPVFAIRHDATQVVETLRLVAAAHQLRVVSQISAPRRGSD